MRTDTYTYAEIADQPRAWRETLRSLPQQWDRVDGTADAILAVGCGSSYYLALSAAYLLRRVGGRPAEAHPASELFLHEPAVYVPGRRYLTVGCSRSGETTETAIALRRARERGLASTIAVTCTPDSSTTKVSDAQVVLPEGRERSVVMTKSFTTMLLALQYWAGRLGGNAGFQAELNRLPDALDAALARFAEPVAELGRSPDLDSFVYLGSGACYGLACEAGLKVKEMAGQHSVAYHPLEFRHGPISIVRPGTLVTWFVSDEAEAREAELLPELKRLGAKVLALGERADDAIRQNADLAVALGSGLSTLARLPLYLALAQLLAYSCTVSRGLDPDNPKNLTQVVRLNG